MTTLPGHVGPCSPWTPFEASYRVGVSVDRLRRYQTKRDEGAWSAGIGRYLYNIEVARALVPALNWAEISLRNRLDAVVGEAFPVGGSRSHNRVPSWLDATPPVLLAGEQQAVLDAIGWFDRRHPPKAGGTPSKRLTPGRLVAELHFGFWTRLLDGVYADWRKPVVFWPKLLERTFPNCSAADRTRKAIHLRFTEIKELRNRVCHHERVVHMADLDTYDRILEAIDWVDSGLADDLRTLDRPRFKQVLDAGAASHIAWAQSEPR